MVEGKKPAVRAMFNAIAPRYDLLNRVLSGGIDQSWRRKVIRTLMETAPESVLDVATGTADLAIMAARNGVAENIGVDISEDMLEVGRRKVSRAGLQEQVILETGDAEALPYPEGRFDAATVSFGVRNFEDLDAGLRELHRVLKPGGRLIVLEFSRPRAFPVKQFYSFYNARILPLIGRMVSGDSGAYTYLPESIAVFPDGDDFERHLTDAGFAEPSTRRLTFGIASLYVGVKSPTAP
ncbi:MAG: bifunctional demethylmenaquinone methyltransferase/2-methoxy-6-polyprenyl-1,4-benzoquinol methylase UbiE [Rhodothermales bacterium]